MKTLNEAKVEGRKIAKWAAERIKDRREASAFGEAHGMSHTFANSIIRSNDPQISRLILIADWLEMSLTELLEEAQAQESATGGLDLMRPPRRPLDIVSRAAALLDDSSTVSSGDAFIASALEEIDSLRYENPFAAQMKLAAILDSLPGEQMPYALNVAASCYRMIQEFGKSALCANTAGLLAAKFKNRLAQGDHFQRWVYLLSDVSMKPLALKRNGDSREKFLEASAVGKVAETVVDRAYCLEQLGRIQDALDCYLAAGELDEHLSFRNRVTWRQAAAGRLTQLHKIRDARSFLAEALDLVNELDPSSLLRNQVLWQRGLIEASAQRVDTAERLMVEVATQLSKSHPADSLLALLDLAAIFLGAGQNTRCSRLLGSVKLIDKSIASIPPIRDAVLNLHSLVQLQRVTLAAIEECAGVIQANRARYYLSRAALAT